jgi:redox-sensitive bicupin YhaK (pirin superfamily)
MADAQIHPSEDRLRTESDRIVSRHSFSFGSHYDPGNLGFGVLIAHNEELIQPGGGFAMHPHKDTEIVTWVLAGSLYHEDSRGGRGITTPGIAQRLSAGTGVQHSELTAEEGEPLHLVQMWVAPDRFGADPDFAQADVAHALAAAELTPVASGMAKHRLDAPLRLHQAGAGMSVAALPRGSSLNLPTAYGLHLFVTRGAVTLETDGVAEYLAVGDAARLKNAQGEMVRAVQDSEILVWELAE